MKLSGTAELSKRLVIAVHALNTLLRIARTFGVHTHVDTVERDGYTEIVVTVWDSNDRD